jgi:hypothetical protein
VEVQVAVERRVDGRGLGGGRNGDAEAQQEKKKREEGTDESFDANDSSGEGRRAGKHTDEERGRCREVVASLHGTGRAGFCSGWAVGAVRDGSGGRGSAAVFREKCPDGNGGMGERERGREEI